PGLLRFTSTPTGLRYNGDFISGTRDEVTGTYRSTCCSPRVLINAIDALGNTNSYIIDITSKHWADYLTPAAISAIVLGVIVLIALLALIVFLIYWCVKRRKEERELPTYTSRNMN
ncbi:uncharacterized protein LOC126973504, partial [Leptidea sinapis]|uniref:uncharacterized protein LOC126973504 n=1 Tax=Leptidea sinapis TaxID=189913 RepID=UPI0021C446CF